jgi:hypothetical protein
MTPIHRIPKEGNSLEFIVAAERDMGLGNPEVGDILAELIDHSGNQESLSITLDWAMEIRNSQGISWGESISLAMTLFFG